MPDPAPKRQDPSGREAPGRRSVVVFCGAHGGSDPRHVEEARRLGRGLAADGWRVVTGAGGTGLMGAVNDGAIEKGGETLGILPGFLASVQPVHPGIGATDIVDNLFERTRRMFFAADAGIALPGGLGTFAEVTNFLLLHQLHRHAKPLLFVDGGGYWDPLFAMFERMIAEGFLDAPPGDAFLRLADADGAAAALRRLFPPPGTA